jgi:excisionase family DNA binding protein
MMTPIAYSIAEACKVCSLGRTTIYAAIKRGELPTCKVGRRTLITAQALSAWINNSPSSHDATTDERHSCLLSTRSCQTDKGRRND